MQPQKLIGERAASSSSCTRRPPQCTSASSSHKKSPSKTGGGACLSSLLSSSSRLSVHPRQQSRQDLRVEGKHTCFGTGLRRWCQWRRLRALSHEAAVVHSGVRGRHGPGGGCCQWTAVTTKKEEMSEIEANANGRMTTCRSSSPSWRKGAALKARGSDRRSGCVVRELYSKNVVPKVELRQVSRTRVVDI